MVSVRDAVDNQKEGGGVRAHLIFNSEECP